MAKENCNILIVGVGGQGNILAGKVISQAFVAAGYDVKQSEVHGMAQRGGAVSSHVRAGEKIYSPLVPEEGADFILSFEYMEILRYLNFAGKQTTALINTLRVDPPVVASGSVPYPADVLDRVKKKTKSILVVDANTLAKQIGTERVFNSVLVGVLAAYLPIKKNVWTRVYRELVKENLVDINLQAFDAGLALANENR